jgi:hypothetical protein
MLNFPEFEGQKVECGFLLAIAHTREAMGDDYHGFYIGFTKYTKRC